MCTKSFSREFIHQRKWRYSNDHMNDVLLISSLISILLFGELNNEHRGDTKTQFEAMIRRSQVQETGDISWPDLTSFSECLCQNILLVTFLSSSIYSPVCPVLRTHSLLSLSLRSSGTNLLKIYQLSELHLAGNPRNVSPCFTQQYFAALKNKLLPSVIHCTLP